MNSGAKFSLTGLSKATELSRDRWMKKMPPRFFLLAVENDQ
jgi:hypothetical protein